MDTKTLLAVESGSEAVATCTGLCVGFIASHLFGIDNVYTLWAGFVGSIFGLAITPPFHWSGLLKPKQTNTWWAGLLNGLTRIGLVAFIMCANTVFFTILAVAAYGWATSTPDASLTTRMIGAMSEGGLAVLACGLGQFATPRILFTLGKFITRGAE